MNFQAYVQKGEEIVNEVAQELGLPDDKNLAGRILRAVLHTVRARLQISESLQLLAQLPMMIKAVYVDGWKYQEKPLRMKTIGDFVREVIHEEGAVGHHDIQTVKDGENAVRSVINVLKRHISEGEIHHIRQNMPPDLKPLWEG